MSAITGIFYRDGRNVNPEVIKKMNNILSHRGPDCSAIWSDGPIAFGHQMLYTTTESLNEILPFHDEKAGLVITADARIDNRKELSEELDIEDKEDVSDSYFILKSYEKWGEKCPEHLLGDFAFAIWDKKKKKLFCSRDHMGIKPFYYYSDDKLFIFGTEIKALFSIPEVNYDLNELKIGLYLKRDGTDKHLTFYKNILSLTAANYICVNQQFTLKKMYWKLDPESRIVMDSDEEYFKAYKEIFTEAVNCRLRSAFPIGSDLSGGLDSSSVVCIAKQLLDRKKSKTKLETFSQVFDYFKESDERYYINKVLDFIEIKSNFIKCDNINPVDQIDTILWHQDQPHFLPFLTILSTVFKKMQQNGFRIHLNGIGGDIVISHGENYFSDLATKLKFKKLFKEVKSSSKHRNKVFYKELIKNLIIPIIPEVSKPILIRIIRYFNLLILQQKEQIYSEPHDFLNNDFTSRTKIMRFREENEDLSERNLSNAKKSHYNSLFKYTQQEENEVRANLAANFNIESRSPYNDKRMVEFCYAIPTEVKFKYGWDRYIQRASMTDILPKEIQWRPSKTNLINVLKKNLFLFEKNNLENIIYGNEKLINKYINFNDLQKIYKKFEIDNSIAYIHLLNLWQILILSEWLKKVQK